MNTYKIISLLTIIYGANNSFAGYGSSNINGPGFRSIRAQTLWENTREGIHRAYSTFKPLTTEQKNILALMESDSLTTFKLFVKPGDDINTPYGNNTILMLTTNPTLFEYLVNKCNADINEVVWEDEKNLYITVLDRVQQKIDALSAGSEKTNLEKIKSFLKTKKAKTAQELGFQSPPVYEGDYLPGSHKPPQTIVKLPWWGTGPDPYKPPTKTKPWWNPF